LLLRSELEVDVFAVFEVIVVVSIGLLEMEVEALLDLWEMDL